jgi:hypothetical protein
VGLSDRKDNCSSGELTGLILKTYLHELFPLPDQRVPIADGPVNVSAGIVDIVGINYLLGCYCPPWPMPLPAKDPGRK